MICSGGDPDVSAKAAGHSKETKAKYYKKVSCEEAQEAFGRHHTAFVEGGDNIDSKAIHLQRNILLNSQVIIYITRSC